MGRVSIRFAVSALCKGLRADVRGAALTELAFVAMPFFALVIGVLQITTTFFAQQALETASDKAVRQLIVGSAQRSRMTKEQFRSSVCSKLPSFMKCANLMVDVRTVASFSNANTTTPTITFDGNGNPTNDWRYAPGAGGEITVARIMYIWNVQLGPMNLDLSTMTGNRRLLTAVSVFKAEPFS